MELEFFIPHRFPSLNTVIEKARRHWAESSRQKRELTDLCEQHARHAAQLNGWTMPEGPVEVEFIWHERSRRRDQDNITSAQKFVLDGIVRAGLLHDDSQKWIPQPSTNRIVVDKAMPGVTVRIRGKGKEEGK